MLKAASVLASGVESFVGTIVTDTDRRAFARAFPELCDLASSLGAAFEADVVHCNVRQMATLFITPKCVALTGEHRLHVVVPYQSIAALRHGRCGEPDGPGMPPKAILLPGRTAVAGGRPARGEEEHEPVLMLFTKSRKMIPIFNIRPLATRVGLDSDTGSDGEAFRVCFGAMEECWRDYRRTAARTARAA